jgi:double-stranded RNA binding motif
MDRKDITVARCKLCSEFFVEERTGRSKKEAEQQAAADALSRIKAGECIRNSLNFN